MRRGRLPKAAPPARFAHIDQTRKSVAYFIDLVVGEVTRAGHRTSAIFNVWRPITPGPHNTALAICDHRSIPVGDLVEGRTVASSDLEGAPYLTSVPSPEHRWFYFSNLASDEAIVFKGVDLDPAIPIGCMHSAFEHPHPVDGDVPRASIETRVIAFFD